MAFKVATSPHVTHNNQTSKVMLTVLLCAIPGFLAQCYFFGWGTLIQVLLAMITAILCEAFIVKLRKRDIKATLSDNSALLTGLLLGVSIPPLAPWWVIIIGTAFAIIMVKQLYGGLGNNIFNPAMAAYVLLLIAFPVQMTSWVVPNAIAQHPADLLASLQTVFSFGHPDVDWYRLGIDGSSMATPLDTLKIDLSMGLTTSESLTKAVFSSGVGVGWVWVNLGYLIGGLIMLKLRTIRWHIPVGVIAGLGIAATAGYLISPDTHASPIFHLFSGATMLAAFFIATDPVTAATSNRGRILFGVIIGVLVYLIRNFGGYPDAFAFAVLLANLCAPLIDYYIKPRAYGHR